MSEKYDAHEIEAEMLKLWEDKNSYQKAKNKNKGKKTFTFLQGPPYTSGRIHIGHAWNNSLKDVVLRYKRMKGFDVWDRAGYDMHGLPTENKVQAKHKLKYKEDIEKFGLNKFIKECIKFSTDNANLMDKDLQKLGIWMDYENAYWPIRNEYIENEWWLISQADKNKRLYKDKKVMTWCASCETALAKHELEYNTLKEPSIFLKLKIKDTKNEYLLIWTTTPWTIPFNLAVMVNPELNYVKIKVDNEYWIVAEALVGTFMGAVMDKKYKLIETFLGEKLEGVKYEHPLKGEYEFEQENVKLNPKTLHSVLLSKEYVDTSAGTGLVHCAPGCGPEDFKVGREYGLGPFNTLSEQGVFPKSMGIYQGKIAKQEDKFFVKHYKENGCLLETTRVEHEYPHCWRCHNPVIFRTTDQWFFKIEDLKERMIKSNTENVTWVPKFGTNAMNSWFENLRDNGITRQRFWGCPAPIWECECGKYYVFGSAKELEKKALTKIPENLHKPWIDEVKIKCDCGKEIARTPDVLDVWIDSGTAGWNCYNFPKEKDIFKKHFPADFILEATEQVRLWFSMLQIAYNIAFDNTENIKKFPTSYKNVYMHGMILDFQGVKMSKSLGNIISPYEVIDKYGADILRYYMCGVPAGQNISFQWDEVKQKSRSLGVLYNITNFLLDYVKVNDVKIVPLAKIKKGKEEDFMISKLNSTIAAVTEKLDGYYLDEAISIIEQLFLTLSRTYMQLTRDKAAAGTIDEKQAVASIIGHTLMSTVKMLSLYCPFVSEKIYQRTKDIMGEKEESIHMSEFPVVNKKDINQDLEKAMDGAMGIIQSVLAAREKAKLNVRWPVAKVIVDVAGLEDEKKIIKMLGGLIKQHANVKDIETTEMFSNAVYSLKPNYKVIGDEYGQQTGDIAKVISTTKGDDAKALAEKLIKDSKVEIKLGKDTITLNKNQVNVEVAPNEPFKMANNVYLDTTRTDELDNEGLAREVIRRVQTLRKDEGLTRDQKINLQITLSDRLKQAVDSWESTILEKCGLSGLNIGNVTAKNKQEYKIKDELILIGF